MILIKCCDISNEVRPFEVSEPWADCLLEEYFMQVRIKCNVKWKHLKNGEGVSVEVPWVK